jgi:hypothetical protein
LEGLEKGSLTGITSSGTLGNNYIDGSDSTNTSGSGTDVGLKNLTNLTKVSVGEDESDVSAAAFLKLGNGSVRVFLDVFTDTLSHHGVLSHQDLSLPTKSQTSRLDLHGTNVVDVNNETLVVRGHECLHCLEVSGLTFCGERHLDLLLCCKKK